MHAVLASAVTNTPLVALTRPPWQPGPGDRWTPVPDIGAAVAALHGPARRVMLAIGRAHLPDFASQPQHHYLVRLVDDPVAPPPLPLPLPDHTVIVGRGPFDTDADRRLMQDHRIDLLVCRNAGGPGSVAKLLAARALSLPVVMIDRPVLPPRTEVFDIDRVLAWIAQR